MKMKLAALLMAALMCGASIAGILARPNSPEDDAPNFLEKTVPVAFGDWRKMDDSPQILDPGTAETLRKIYRETLSRTYVNAAGYPIMLSMARSGNQIGVQEAHRPEVCYPAQGFEVLGKVESGTLPTAYGSIEVNRLTASLRARNEPITYWLTMGDRVVRTQWDKRVVQFLARFTGQSPGGLLFRVSSIDRDPERAFAMQQKFVADMMASLSPEDRRKLSGLTPPRS